MLTNLKTVLLFEYTRTVKRVGFWLTTLFLPVFIFGVMGISAWSSINTESTIKNSASKLPIVLIDESNTISSALIVPPLEVGGSKEAAITQVKEQKKAALIYVPADFLQSQKYEIYAQDKGPITNQTYSSLFSQLIKESVLTTIASDAQRAILNDKFSSHSTYYDQKGNEVKGGFESLILPAIAFMIFILSVFISAQYLLQSVAEEKENRMIETLLSIIRPRELIWGKIIGLSLVVITQLAIWIIGGLVAFVVAGKSTALSISLSWQQLADYLPIGSLLFILLFTFLGFFLFAAIMVGVGSISTSQRESQSLSSIFIITAILPMYFMGVLLSDPGGTLARFFSYFPTSSAFTLLLRNSMNALPTYELVIGLLLNIAYVLIAFWIAVKLFNLGILMYNRKPKLKEIMHAIKS